MKRSKIGALVVAIGSVFPAPHASATTEKTYPGAICTPVPGTGGTYATYGGTVANTSTTSSLTVNCPLFKDGAGIIKNAWIEVFDRNDAQDVTCTVITAEASTSSGILYWWANSESSSGYGSSMQTLLFDAEGLVSDAYFFASCVIPPVENGNTSHVAAIGLNEW